ncbi:MAG: VCBS repeat-containing protein [Saprospirales bacterium]|nr:VCBS repeat-containing protein [Saprospirales bacterium]MBK8491694.1 VCBS repeat-containing protein [Saprospirales bacterium]
MHRNFTPYARKVRQFRHLSKKVNRLLESGRFHQMGEGQQLDLISKLRTLYRRLSKVFSTRQLRGALAGAALLLGLGMNPSAQAQTFGPQVVTPFNFANIAEYNLPGFADIDGDGDQDLFVSGYTYGGSGDFSIRFYENVGTPAAPDFAAPVDQAFGLDDLNMFNPVFVDIDNDGDVDLFMPQYYYGNIWFRENTGTNTAPVFAPTQTNPFGLGSLLLFPFISFVDIDDDGDFDMFATEFYAVTRFYENTGTPESPVFAAPVNNPFGITPPPYAVVRTFDFSDVDNDGDQDLLYHDLNGDEYASAVFFMENTGTASAPVFATPVQGPSDIFINGYYLNMPTFVDIDNDGDEDLFVGTYIDNGGLFYYENLNSTNALPLSNDADVTTQENVPYTFAATDFPFNDADLDDMLEGIKITGLVSVGSLTYNGNPVVLNQEIAAADLGGLVFTPNANEFGVNYDSFSFKVTDGQAYSTSSFTMTIDVQENVGTTENTLHVKAVLSPNPASESLRLTMVFQDNPGTLTVSIVDALGQVQFTDTRDVFQTTLQTALDVSKLTPGMYFVQLRAGDRFTTLRFVKN